MSEPWLHIVGIGEDGMDGLVPATRAVVEAAEIIIGGDRHHRLSETVAAERVAWPSPFDALIGVLESYRGKRVVVLATGDPLWFSVGARIGRAIDPREITYHPQLSAFQLAGARMGWSMPDVETLTVHGRPVVEPLPPGERITPRFPADPRRQRGRARAKTRIPGRNRLSRSPVLPELRALHGYRTSLRGRRRVSVARR